MTDLEKVSLNQKLDNEGGIDALLFYGQPTYLLKKYPEFKQLVDNYENAATALEDYLWSDKDSGDYWDPEKEDFSDEFNKQYSLNWEDTTD